MRTAHQSSFSSKATEIQTSMESIRFGSLLKRVRHLGCIDLEGRHNQAGSTTNYTLCTLAADIDANRQCTLQMVKHITYLVMLPHTAEDSHTCTQ